MRSPRSVRRHLPDVEDHRLSAGRCVCWRETRAQIRGCGSEDPPFWAIAAPKQRGRRAVADEILVKRLERGLRSATKGRPGNYVGNPG
jgi:hypothetical protein